MYGREGHNVVFGPSDGFTLIYKNPSEIGTVSPFKRARSSEDRQPLYCIQQTREGTENTMADRAGNRKQNVISGRGKGSEWHSGMAAKKVGPHYVNVVQKLPF